MYCGARAYPIAGSYSPDPRFGFLYLSYALLTLVSFSNARPGMGDTVAAMRREANKVKRAESKQLIGDLRTLKDTQLASIGKDIKAILLSQPNAESNIIDTSIPAGSLGSAACKADLCCDWKRISYEMTAKSNGTSGRCTKLARQAVRLGFHDAGVCCADNNGLAAIADLIWYKNMQTWYKKYPPHGVGMADLIQMGANVANVICPLGPRIRSFVGRKDNSRAGPTGLLPGYTDSAGTLLKLFAAKTIDAHDLVALVGAHTTSQQHSVDHTREGDPQDSTPGIWDIESYSETTGAAAPRVLRPASDINLSEDPRPAPEWADFSDPSSGQEHWNDDYAPWESTKVLPPHRARYVAPDQPILDLWLQGQFDQLNNLVDDAVMLTDVGAGGSGTVIIP
ncbi:class II peroxidase [Didymella exigua CBS 183.55]|uniref:Peroxidase n=1 Tax=Didymella exigua CBS 183.55 TaxID=1150837 RepID=A0A6A5R6N7_9PLEO|nr:class II peroxidase [Didymella exigua CBS 183.55]KAF1923059.1 class II peroxidase [Didymella exigua CBS 183.55]